MKLGDKMAEVVKVKERKTVVKSEEKEKQKKTPKTEKKPNTPREENKNLWEKFITFCHGVRSEFKKVRWTSKKDMVKYSVATIVFIVFCSLFFYGIDTIFALIQSLFS